MRRGASTISIIGAFVVIIALVWILLTIYNNVTDQFISDTVGLAACNGRAAQAGGRGFCSATSDCSEIPNDAGVKGPAPNEYAQYLLPCKDDKGNEIKETPYCCAILPDGKNPPVVEKKVCPTKEVSDATSVDCAGKEEGTLISNGRFRCKYNDATPPYCSVVLVNSGDS